ncbi:sugar O-acyltransferase, sialic acid O-acetyltransferase NeuD family [Pseudomonas mohnii]|jgi:sugar O-acyltransferase (sialic acid O-acetyltransferase NeuD family)|uniref:Sugar O-acyltransferase, sialic acid O-acetyltransferase NeuD family n=1 Tax=Pseudomonas mohnii TaxID=395600 RepID=A0ABY0YCT1_9PSED|nr:MULTISPECIES: acetyltransferase [Pseudomonas]POA76361.1 acetyltransferase [Pseudomonas sp. DP16D-R1]SED35022.1 sugar O-acyltransferase, sialic acid O-acetyltransferase NeuD family [Pseudomonas mohnii]
MKKYFGIIGAGGYGREVIPLAKAMVDDLLASDSAELYFVVEGEIGEDTINGYPVISLDRFLSLSGERLFSIAIGASDARERISAVCESQGAKPFSVIAGNAVILDGNEIAEGAVLSPFVTVTSNAKIGKHFHANIYSYVAHDCVIGDFVTFAPGVKCNGNVVIEDHAYIGTGASIIQGKASRPLTIGRGAIVGMGAVVTKSVPPGITVVGNPARPLTREAMRK